jgi:hypothetical protein
MSPSKAVITETFGPPGKDSPKEPPKGTPKSLQIIYEDYLSSGTGAWHQWHFFEGTPGKAVDICSDNALFSVDAPTAQGSDPP